MIDPEKLATMAEIVNGLPDNRFANIESKIMGGKALYNITVQATTQADAKALRQASCVRKWTKRFNEECLWWEYTATFNDIHLKIYAVREAPPTCKLVEETYKVLEDVPVEFEQKMTDVPIRYERVEVERTRQHWVCQ